MGRQRDDIQTCRAKLIEVLHPPGVQWGFEVKDRGLTKANQRQTRDDSKAFFPRLCCSAVTMNSTIYIACILLGVRLLFPAILSLLVSLFNAASSSKGASRKSHHQQRRPACFLCHCNFHDWEDTSCRTTGSDYSQYLKYLAWAAGLALFGLGASVFVPYAAASLPGFGASGIVGGSAAAASQAAVGNIAAGSLFASLQSLRATGTYISGMMYGGATAMAGGGTMAASMISKEQCMYALFAVAR